MLADRAYDAAPLRDCLVEQGSELVIPGRRNRKTPIEHDRVLYRERTIVARLEPAVPPPGQAL